MFGRLFKDFTYGHIRTACVVNQIAENAKILIRTAREKIICPRANGAKRRSGRKPGARVTNRALGKLKVVGDGRRVKVIRFLALGMS